MTKVVFRKWREGGEIIALFPEVQWNAERDTITSYMHVGQHGDADYHHVLAATTSAREDEYKYLLAERRIVDEVHVVDDNSNGFRVIYATINNVTIARLGEIQSRQTVRDSLKQLKMLAPLYFGDMLYTDIYDFADFAVLFDPADIRIHNIFVHGREKERLYIGDNPRLENEAEYINSGTAQGLLYLKYEDIYYNSGSKLKVYRYLRCHGLNERSDTDEHFSHFTEHERIY